MNLVLALNLLQFAIQAVATYYSFLIATNGKTRAGYLMALGMLAFAIHNIFEMLMEEEQNYYVVVTKFLASILFLATVWLLNREIMAIIKGKEEAP
ncbi:MAG: hypothetical protein HY555_00475 [Euryarchaeota archaeon]|nr:hypothetical protein [Euryarchaeota archaeon]